MCTINLKSVLTDGSYAGVLEWSEQYNCATTPSCPNEVVAPGSLVILPAGWTTPTEIDVTGVAAGTYTLYYRTGDICVAGNCEDCNSVDIEIVVGPVVTACTDTTACDRVGCDASDDVDVYDLIFTSGCVTTPTPASRQDVEDLFSINVAPDDCTGTFSGYDGEVIASGHCVGGWNCNTGIFSPCLCGPGTLTLDFTVENLNGTPPADPDTCDSCRATFSIDIVVSAGESAGTPQNATLCN